MNIALISGLISRVSVRLVGRRYAAWFSTAAIALYTLFVGSSAAVVRAAVMGSIAVWGGHFGRQNASANALFGTALLMTLWNPHTLLDLGFLLAASVGAPAERAMLAHDLPGVRCDVLQVGRHGSEAASTPVFLEAVRPALAVISAGEGNRAGDPDERTLARLSEVGATVVRTDEVGSVEVISDGVGYEVKVGR